jgi:hypothetical protein
MTTLLDGLAVFLVERSASLPANQQLTLGVNFFLARFPAEAPNACVLLQQYEGQGPTFTFGDGISVLEAPRIQLLVRGEREDYPGAYDWAYALRNILGSVTKTTDMSGISVLRLEPLGIPNPTGYDDVDRPKFTCNFQTHIATP